MAAISHRALSDSARASLSEVFASLEAWAAHAAHADTWRLREAMLGDVVLGPVSTIGDTDLGPGASPGSMRGGRA